MSAKNFSWRGLKREKADGKDSSGYPWWARQAVDTIDAQHKSEPLCLQRGLLRLVRTQLERRCPSLLPGFIGLRFEHAIVIHL